MRIGSEMKVAACLFIVLVMATYCAGKPDYRNAAQFLHKYGWMDSNVDDAQDTNVQEVIKEPLASMKAYYALGTTAELDQQTEAFMSKPRCGASDGPAGSRKRRWTRLSQDVWKTMPVTVSFKNYHNGAVSKATQVQLAKECSTLWAGKSGLSFTMLADGSVGNIHIEFTNLGGPGGTVGFAWSPQPWTNPPSTGLQLDATETWKERTSSPGDGIPMLAALCHEFGHALGLGHSNVRAAVMYPVVGLTPNDALLDQDDISGIQTLYPLSSGQNPGDKNNPVTEKPRTAAPPAPQPVPRTAPPPAPQPVPRTAPPPAPQPVPRTAPPPAPQPVPRTAPPPAPQPVPRTRPTTTWRSFNPEPVTRPSETEQPQGNPEGNPFNPQDPNNFTPWSNPSNPQMQQPQGNPEGNPFNPQTPNNFYPIQPNTRPQRRHQRFQRRG